MQLDLQHSIRTWLAQQTGMNCVWIFDGVKLPTTKPFLTIEQMPNTVTQLSKLRETMATTYRFQVGLFASSSSERAKLQETVKDILMFDEIPIVTATVPAQTIGSFYVNVTAETPIPADEISNTTNYHHMYFDIAVELTKNRGNR